MQLGFGTPGGCEAAVHAARQFVSSRSSDHPLVLLEVEYHNAFSSVRRDCFIRLVKEKFKCLFLFVWLAHRNPSHLFFENSVVSSASR